MDNIYVLFACDMYRSRQSMRLVSTTTDKDTLMAMIAGLLLNGNMDYERPVGVTAFDAFHYDFQHTQVDVNKLKYGFVDERDNAQHNKLETLPSCSLGMWDRLQRKSPVVTSLEELNVADRSLIFSEVDLCGGGCTMEFLAPGIPDQNDIEENENYQHFQNYFDEPVEVSVNVRSYLFGNGESVSASENELVYIHRHRDEIEEAYGIDCIQSNDFTMYSEQENDRD